MRLARDGNVNAGIVNRLLQSRERLIGALLMGNNIVNITASTLATGLLLAWFGEVGVIAVVVLVERARSAGSVLTANRVPVLLAGATVQISLM